MDMLQFFQDKLQFESGFAQLLSDIGINKEIFFDGEIPCEEQGEEEEMEMHEVPSEYAVTEESGEHEFDEFSWKC